jgi:hypothetical protein
VVSKRCRRGRFGLRPFAADGCVPWAPLGGTGIGPSVGVAAAARIPSLFADGTYVQTALPGRRCRRSRMRLPLPPETCQMKSRAAVAFAAGRPLQVVEIDVAPPPFCASRLGQGAGTGTRLQGRFGAPAHHRAVAAGALRCDASGQPPAHQQPYPSQHAGAGRAQLFQPAFGVATRPGDAAIAR